MVFLLLSACGGGSGGSSTRVTEYGTAPALSLGQAQKGPFEAGGLVTLYRLDTAGNRTGESASTLTGDLGWFVPAAPWAGLTELEVEGAFFDETTGTVSAQPLRLVSMARLPAAETVRLNLFTHLASARTRALMGSGASYDAARDTAYAELRALFYLLASDSGQLAQLDLSDGSGMNVADNANLLLFSAAVLAAGIEQGELDALAGDFAGDGLVNATALPQWLRVTVHAGTIDLDEVRLRLESLENLDRAPGFDALGNSYPAWVNLAGDADADGVPDPDEILLHGSDPLLADSDVDGLPDGWEVANQLDPLLDDAGADPDSDGLTNLDELSRLTDPRNADSDGDTWLDGFEISAGGDPNDAASLPLVFLSSPSTSVETGFAYAYTAQVTWPNVSFSLDQAPAGVAVDPDTGAVSWTPTLAQIGDFDITLRASAAGYIASQSFVISTAPGNTGDINEDGVVDARDILLGQRIMLGLLVPDAAQQVRGDLTANGAVQGSDIVKLERMVMGL